MAKTWYGSFNNRLEENRQFCDEITVGTGVTEYFYSDRNAYEVTAVKDQKHITIREYDHKLKGDAYSNDWELISNEDNPEIDLVKRGKYWYHAVTCTPELVKKIKEGDDVQAKFWLAYNFDADKIIETGKAQTRYHKRNISVGKASYHYDYEF